MSKHHSGEPHDIQALQRHLSDAHILTEPHAPVHDVLRHAGLLHEIEDSHHHKADHYASHGIDVDVHYDSEGEHTPYHHYTRTDSDSDSDDDHHKHHYKKYHDKHHHKDHHYEKEHHIDALEALARHHDKEVEIAHKAIEDDFAHKLMDFKQSQTGHEFRLFGHTMVSYDQLQYNVKHNQCVELKAEHMYHTETASKWICQRNLDDFWAGRCITMEPHIALCDENGINVFLGKCVHTDCFKVCPSDPIVVEHLVTDHAHDEEETPNGCYRGHHGKLMCPSDLHKAFEHGSCFRVDHRFICEEDMDHIKEEKCVTIGEYELCGLDMFRLFHGEHITMADGHELVPDFPTAHVDHHSALCRTHQDIEFCLENILDLY